VADFLEGEISMLILTDQEGSPVVAAAVAVALEAREAVVDMVAVVVMVVDRNRRKSYSPRTLDRESLHWAKPNFQINQVNFSGWLFSTITTLKHVHKSNKMSRTLVQKQRGRSRLEQ